MATQLMLSVYDGQDQSELSQVVKQVSEICFQRLDQLECSRLDLIFVGQDDSMINFNLDCLKREINRTSQATLSSQPPPDLQIRDLNSHFLFIKLLISISFDYQVMIDWLISNETNFLLYLVKYLKFLLGHLQQTSADNKSELIDLSGLDVFYFDHFAKFLSRANGVSSASASGQLENRFYLKRSFECLAELTGKMKSLKSVFPYNCEPLLKLLRNLLTFNT